MKIFIVLLLAIIVTIQYSEQLENLVDTPIHNCIKCLCHARTGCFNQLTCANYSINMDYWRSAGSPTLNLNDPDNEQSFAMCMSNLNCVLNTIKLYTDSFEQTRCDCNDVYDCRDMLMLHVNGESCKKAIENDYMMRYNSCASRNGLARITTASRCIPEAQ